MKRYLITGDPDHKSYQVEELTREMKLNCRAIPDYMIFDLENETYYDIEQSTEQFEWWSSIRVLVDGSIEVEVV